YYPVNDQRNSDLFKQYKNLAKQSENVIFGGRLANYQYYDMDQVFNAALKAVAKEFEPSGNA
ncbi:MAG: UDP-galactopyranose mutase, partial [Streptococcaceae bacterium]|nr:UDP-galactopyranose mutase [Streptococcaceae bacterium]